MLRSRQQFVERLAPAGIFIALSSLRRLAPVPPTVPVAVLVLGEATSSIDTETELMMRRALDVAMARRTTIAIAHRLSTVQGMDKILVLHRGELREGARTAS